MAKNKKKTTSSRRSPVRTRQHIQADIPDKSALALAAVPLHPSSPARSSPLKTLAGGSSPDKYLICPKKNEVIVAEKAISPSTADHVLVEDCSDYDAFEEDEVDYSISEYASGGSSKFFRSPTPIPAIGKLDLPSGEELVAPPPQPLGDSEKSASNAAPPAQHASSPGKSPVPAPSKWRDLFSSKQNPDRLGKVLQTNKEHDKEHAEAAHTKKGNDKGQPEVIRNNMGNDKGKTVVGDTCLDPMHMEADEWETVRGKHTKKLLSPRGNNVQAVELHAGLSVGVSTRSGGRKHANKGQGRGRAPPATPAK
ncbi:hypothetical protein NC651_027012 [Populus alba x Populus x berolinensis]|nr:hypothetical protein NC651_027012 [Populus alba x Populus x berolinensis]